MNDFREEKVPKNEKELFLKLLLSTQSYLLDLSINNKINGDIRKDIFGFKSNVDKALRAFYK